MTADMPPPPVPQRHPGTNWLRIGGVLVAFSAPISGFVLYAFASVVFGEERFEGDGGLTPLGWSMFVIPVVVGLGLLALSVGGRSGPSQRVVGLAAAGLAACCLLGGLLALFTADAGDASIGGGLLILAGVALAVLGVLLLRARGYRPQSH